MTGLTRCSLGHDLRKVDHGYECSRPGCGFVNYHIHRLVVTRDDGAPTWMYVVFVLLLIVGVCAASYVLNA